MSRLDSNPRRYTLLAGPPGKVGGCFRCLFDYKKFIRQSPRIRYAFPAMKNTVTLHTKPINDGPFNCQPARTLELELGRMLCNDIVLPWEPHLRNMRAWVIGNEFGAMGVVWAEHA